MSMSEAYQPINCDDYDNLELACQHHLILTLELRDGNVIKGKASDLFTRKKVEYLLIEISGGESHELRLDRIASFSNPEIGTVVVSVSD